MPGFGFVDFGIWTCTISVCIPLKVAAALTTTARAVVGHCRVWGGDVSVGTRSNSVYSLVAAAPVAATTIINASSH
ncbi:hypothetical protein DPMN_003369 [Dreissena polymorpha]|uniref:Secreted protein n=1 Tax=Dreissena polymorpha TaxID=45954 RepID=A0A9D4RS22_DREPO|nr:hypothetical protein DPMN_003369 [Dreissena polymorpha]